MILADVSVRRPVFATMGIAALVVMGIFAYRSLVVDLFPKTDIPVVAITTTLPGAGPEEMEARVTKVLEEAINTVSGIDEMRSVTLEGFSRVIVVFLLERNLEDAAQDVRDKIGTILKQLPEGTDPPVVEKFDPDTTPDPLPRGVGRARSARADGDRQEAGEGTAGELAGRRRDQDHRRPGARGAGHRRRAPARCLRAHHR